MSNCDAFSSNPNPWDAVVKYLNETPDTSETPRYTLRDEVQFSNPQTTVVPFPGRVTPLQQARRRQHQKTAAEQKTVVQETVAADGSAEEDIGWAIEILSNITDYDSAVRVWQLPNAALRRACDSSSLDLKNASGLALAQFIRSVLSDSAVSLENQQYLLGLAAASEWFSSQPAIPAVVQGQLSTLLATQSMAIAQGLVARLIEEPRILSTPAAGLIAKLLKSSDMPAATTAWVLSEAIAVAKRKIHGIGESDALWTVVEAGISALPSGNVSAGSGGLGGRWAEMLQTVVPANSKSKKLSVCMLHFVNKLGAQLTGAELDQIVGAAGMLATPLKRSIVAAADRKRAR